MALTPGRWSPLLLHSQYSQLSPERIEALKAKPWLYQDPSPTPSSSPGERRPLPTSRALEMCIAEPLEETNNLQPRCAGPRWLRSANSFLGQGAGENEGARVDCQHRSVRPSSKVEHARRCSDDGVPTARLAKLRGGQSTPSQSDRDVQKTHPPHTSSGEASEKLPCTISSTP